MADDTSRTGGLEASREAESMESIQKSSPENVEPIDLNSVTTDPATDVDELKLPPRSSRYVNVGGNFYTGIDVTSEDSIKRREKRAKRFGLKCQADRSQTELAVSKLEARSKRFGMKFLLAEGLPVRFLESLPPVPAGRIRPEALHLHGTDEMSTEDVFQFFALYSPRNIEWINDQSCNIVWEDELSAKRALVGLRQQPVALLHERREEEGEEAGDGTSPDELLLSSGQEEEAKGENMVAERKTGEGIGEETGEGGEEGEVEGRIEREREGVQWWLAIQHPKAKQLLLRHATTDDQKKPGSARHSQYYRRHGNPNAPTRRAMDLRGRLGRKRPTGGDEVEMMEVESTSDDPLASLVKRPKSMHADREEEEEEEEEKLEEGRRNKPTEELVGGGEGSGRGGSGLDLRKVLKKKRKWREIHLRLGHYPRVVEEHR